MLKNYNDRQKQFHFKYETGNCVFQLQLRPKRLILKRFCIFEGSSKKASYTNSFLLFKSKILFDIIFEFIYFN